MKKTVVSKSKYVKISALFIVAAVLFTMVLSACGKSPEEKAIANKVDGTYSIGVTLEGGTGKATLINPAKAVIQNGEILVTITWSSSNYDYMLVDGIKYLNESEPGEQSSFTFPVEELPCEISVVADTVAMSKPHEIEYTITFTDHYETDFTTLEKTGDVEVSYANCFSIEEFGPYSLIHIPESGDYFVVPEGMNEPKNLPDQYVVLKQPLDKTYLVATPVMDMVDTLGVIDQIRMSGLKEEDWYIDSAKEALKAGTLIYAGKYSAPDYETILSEGCNLAIENTMIYHNPEVKEKLEELGIPVMVERSSYEINPLGRMEWIKVYGVLFDCLDEANRVFEEEIQKVSPLMNAEASDGNGSKKKIAVFYITANKTVNVRKPNDYISKMIELAGGEYALKDLVVEDENALSTMNMQLEDFYAATKDADILIYNSTTVGELQSVDDLIEKNEIFKEYKAVKEGQVYCTGNNFFQEIMGTCDFITDLNNVINSEDEEYRFLIKL